MKMKRTLERSILVPYINKLSQKIALSFKTYDVKLTYKPVNKMQNKIFTNTKDKIEKEKNLVYKIKCCNCESSYSETCL